MTTQEQIERATEAVPAGEAGDLIDVNRRMIAEAVLAAARPTPEEHERGIEAAVLADCRSALEDVHPCAFPGCGCQHSPARVRSVITAYLAATGGGND